MRSFARFHGQNPANFGVLPLTFADARNAGGLERGETREIEDVHAPVKRGPEVRLRLREAGRTLTARHDLSARQVDVLLAGGRIDWIRPRLAARRRTGS